MLLIITSTGDELLKMLTSMTLHDLNFKNMRCFSDFFSIFGCKRVNCDEMDGDRPRLPANRNCLLYALARIMSISSDFLF